MGEEGEYTVVVTGHREQFHRIRNLVHFLVVQQGITEQDADIVERAVAEACHNALFHKSAGKQNPSFELEMHMSESAIKAIVRNRGKAFNFDEVPPFSIKQDFMEYREGGLGIPMMKRLMDEVYYERKADDLNVVTLVKYIDSQQREEK